MNSMTYNGYTARIDFDADDKIIVGRVIDIDDIITFHGTAVLKFEAAFKTAVDGYIHACEEIARRESAREHRIELLAAMVETDAEFADVRAVADDVDGVAGESVE